MKSFGVFIAWPNLGVERLSFKSNKTQMNHCQWMIHTNADGKKGTITRRMRKRFFFGNIFFRICIPLMAGTSVPSINCRDAFPPQSRYESSQVLFRRASLSPSLSSTRLPRQLAAEAINYKLVMTPFSFRTTYWLLCQFSWFVFSLIYPILVGFFFSFYSCVSFERAAA